jgi:cellobiose phosphorylase
MMQLPLTKIALDLFDKGDWLADIISEQEWVTDKQGFGWFNGYYDNQGERVEGEYPNSLRMTLTGQVFPLMSAVATQEQGKHILQAADRYLWDKNMQGYRLNTNFGKDLPKLGRAFGFAYGHKENGALFNHMSVMFAYALYRQCLPQQAWKVLEGIYTLSQDFTKSRIYPGIPEYFNPRGRGMYPFLTGSAAWYLFTLLTESYGVKGCLGDLLLEPKLVAEQFASADQVKVQTVFAGKNLQVIYHNPMRLDYGKYSIGKISVDGIEKHIQKGALTAQFPRSELAAWPDTVQIILNLDQSNAIIRSNGNARSEEKHGSKN